MQDRHVIEAAGMTRLVIENGKVTEVGEPKISFCPFAKRFASPINPVTPDAVQKNIEHRIRSFGMCTRNRQVLDDESQVLFGASELLTTALKNKTVDAAVICCDGAGTVVVTDPRLIQGIGGRMSGLVETVPYAEVISAIEEAGGIVVDKETASLDALSGIAEAKNRGFKTVAVTVAGFQHELAEEIRAAYPDAVIIGVHTSGVASLDDAKRLCAACDLVFACASQHIRDAAKEYAVVQGGVGVPVFAVSAFGKRIVLERLMDTNETLLIKNMKLPVCDMGKQPDPLI